MNTTSAALAEISSALNSDLQNERKHLNFYLYHASAVAGLHGLEFREWLESAAKGEMAHVLAFQDRIFGLGGVVTAAANAFEQFEAVEDILRYAQQMEREVVSNYTVRLQELEGFAARGVAAARYFQIFYEDQLKDSYEDCERIDRMLLGVRTAQCC
jgi:bacterioferritin (cytochrome b1)